MRVHEKSLMSYDDFQKLSDYEMTKYKQIVVYRVSAKWDDKGQIRRITLQCCGRCDIDLLDENLKIISPGFKGQHGLTIYHERVLIGIDLLDSLDDIIEWQCRKR